MENDSLVITLDPHRSVGDGLYRIFRRIGVSSVAGYTVDGLAIRGPKKHRLPALENPKTLLIRDGGVKPKHFARLMESLSAVTSRVTANLVLNYRLNMGRSGVLVLDPDRESVDKISEIRRDTIFTLGLGLDIGAMSNYIRIGKVDKPDEEKYLLETGLGIEVKYPVLCFFVRNNKCGNGQIERSFLIPTNWHN